MVAGRPGAARPHASPQSGPNERCPDVDAEHDIAPALKALLTRHSLGPRQLREPAPSDADLALMAEAALHAPDHGRLVPFRFKLVRGAAREKLGALFEQVARDAGKDDESIAIEGERGRGAPLTVAVVARIDLGHPVVPAHEQWVAVGGALAQFLSAAHALGYGGKMLSGHKVRHPLLQAAFCAPGETLVGWIALGTPAGAARAKAAPAPKALPADVLQDWT